MIKMKNKSRYTKQDELDEELRKLQEWPEHRKPRFYTPIYEEK